jgi:replication factor C subunit 3/5
MNIPLVEKYRPTDFETIILDDANKLFFTQLKSLNYIPNILLYGPPGTGKTTTILNLIKSYQTTHHELNKGFMIHLNASDERGIDMIRTQIYTFIHSKTLFSKGQKFIILDEVDSMTKCAQQALNHLLNNTTNVCFCLICNYISKIDDSLQSKFIKIKFNTLPASSIFSFLKNIVMCEKLPYTDEQLQHIQLTYGSDIRSMINYMQANQYNSCTNVIHTAIWDKLYHDLKHKDIDTLTHDFFTLSSTYTIDIRDIIKDFLYYIIITYGIVHHVKLIEIALHSSLPTEQLIKYILIKLVKHFDI